MNSFHFVECVLIKKKKNPRELNQSAYFLQSMKLKDPVCLFHYYGLAYSRWSKSVHINDFL